MWCEKCNQETEYNNCPECHSDTVPVPENGVFWCKECNIPIMKEPRRQGEEQLKNNNHKGLKRVKQDGFISNTIIILNIILFGILSFILTLLIIK